MIKKVFVLLFVFGWSGLFGQTVKTDVLVIGGGASGFAAAIQCGRSKVKTILAMPDGKIKKEIVLTPGGIKKFAVNSNIRSGIWAELRNRYRELHKREAGYDTAYNAPMIYDIDSVLTILKTTADTTKNLTVYANTAFLSIKKDGDYWETSMKSDGKTIVIKSRVVVDATDNSDSAIKAGAKF